jgi:predicted SpoU family rRNA methylase
MDGLNILAATMSVPTRTDKQGNTWNYHSQSDHHSKVACWCITFDLLLNCSTLRTHVEAGKVGFGINHELRDFKNNKSKDLDLVICTPRQVETKKKKKKVTLTNLADHWNIALTSKQRSELSALPDFACTPVGTVLAALEAKACMTEHQKAQPRLYDELNSSHLIVHGSNDEAIAAGFVMVNASSSFLSPGRNKKHTLEGLQWNSHPQPKYSQLTIDTVEKLARRTKPGTEGYDAIAVALIDCKNDGSSVSLVTTSPAPQPMDVYHYTSMIHRLGHLYSTRFGHL